MNAALPRIIATALLLMPSGAHAQIAFPADSEICQHEPWRLVFHDEFDGNALDLTHWIPYNPTWSDAAGDYYYTPPAGNAAAALAMIKADDYRSFYSPNNIKVSDGVCRITFRYEPQNVDGATAHFSTGKITARTSFESGRFDIRCRIPRIGGTWAAFWMMGDNGCNHMLPGGGEIDCFEYLPCETELNNVSTSLHGFKRYSCNDQDHGSTEHYDLSDIDDWHIYSTEWDRAAIRYYVDGYLKVTQARYAHGNALADCYPAASLNNGYWRERRDVFPFYSPDFRQTLMAELKSTVDLYTVNFMGICTPSMRSHDDIDEHLSERVWTIDYIRVYQRQNNIQRDLSDLCPTITGPVVVCDFPGRAYTYSVTNYKSIVGYEWMLGDGAKLVKATDSNVEVIFTRAGNTTIEGRWKAATVGCEEYAAILPVRIGAPQSPQVEVITNTDANGFNNLLRIRDSACNTSYAWNIWSNPGVLSRKGPEIKLASNYTPLQYSVHATNGCGGSTASSGAFNAADIREEALLFHPNPARDYLIIHLGSDYFAGMAIVSLKVMDAAGRVLLKSSATQPAADVSFDISGLACGAYSLMISGSKITVRSFTKI